MSPQEVHDVMVEKSAALKTKPFEKNKSEVPKQVVQVVADMAKEKGNNITPQEAKLIKDVTKEMGLGHITEQQVKVISEVSEALGPNLNKDEVKIVVEAVNEVDPEISDDGIEAIADITKKLGSEIKTNDIEVIVEMVEEAEANTNEELKVETESITSHESEVIAEKVRKAGKHMSSTEQKAIEHLTMEMDPTISTQEVEVMSEILKEIGPTIAAETVEMVAKAVKDPDTDVKKEDIKSVAAMTEKLSENLKESPPENIKVVTNMLKQIGPTLSVGEQKMITKIAKESGVDVKSEDTKILFEVMKEMGPNVSSNEVEIISAISKAKEEKSGLLVDFDAPLQSSGGNKDEMTIDGAEIMLSLVKEIGSEPSPSEENEIKEVAMQIDPQLTSSQASVMTAILKEVSSNADVETVQEVSNIVKDKNKLSVEVVDTLSMLMQPLTNEVSVDEIEMVKKVSASMGNQPSMATLSAISDMLEKDGSELTMNDIVIVSDIVSVMGPDLSDNEMKAISVLSKKPKEEQRTQHNDFVRNKFQPAKEAPMSSAEAAKIVEMVESMGPAIQRKEKAKLMKMTKKMKPQLSNNQVKVMTEMLKELAPVLDIEKVEKIEEIVEESRSVVGNELSSQKIQMIGDKVELLEESVTAEGVALVVEVTGNIGRGVTKQEANMVVAMGKKVGQILTSNDVQVVADIVKNIGPQITQSDIEVISVLSEKKESVNRPSSNNGETKELEKFTAAESVKVLNMVKEMGDEISVREEKKLEKMAQALKPELAKEQVEIMTEMLKQLAPVLTIEKVQNISNVAKEVVEDSGLTKVDIANIADQAKELDNEVKPEIVRLVSDMTDKMGPVISNREVKLIQSIAKDAGTEISMKDVKILTEISNEIPKQKLSKTDIMVVAIMSQTPRTENGGIDLSQHQDATEDAMTHQEASKVMEMVHHMGPIISHKEENNLEELIKITKPTLTNNEAAVMSLVIKEVANVIDVEMIHEISEAVQSADSQVTAHEVQMIAGATEHLSKNVSTETVLTVAEMAEQLGPVISRKELRMIERMAKQVDSGLTTKDVKMLCQIAKLMGPNLSESDAKVISIVSEKMVDEADENKDDSKEGLSMTDSKEVLKMVQTFGSVISSLENNKIEDMVKHMDSQATSGQAEIASQIISELAPVLDPKTVQEISETVKNVDPTINAEDIEILADMTAKLSNEVPAEAVEIVAEMTSQLGPKLNRREVQMITKEANKQVNINMTPRDVKIVSEIVKAMGSDLNKDEKKMIAIMTKAAIVEDAPSKQIQKDATKLSMIMKFKSRGQSLPPRPKKTKEDESLIGFGMKKSGVKKPKKIPIRNKQKFANFMASLKHRDNPTNQGIKQSESPQEKTHSSRDRSRKRLRQPSATANEQTKHTKEKLIIPKEPENPAPVLQDQLNIPVYHSKVKFISTTSTPSPPSYQFPNFTPMQNMNDPLQPKNATAELMNFLMGFEISTITPEVSATKTPFTIFNPGSTSTEQRPLSKLSTAPGSEILPSGFPSVPGIPIFKAVPEQLRNVAGSFGQSFPSGNFMEFSLGNEDINVPDSSKIRPDLSDKLISLGGEEGNNYMAFTLGGKKGSSAKGESAENQSEKLTSAEQLGGNGIKSGSNVFDENIRRIRQSLKSKAPASTSHPHHRYKDQNSIRTTTRISFAGPSPFTVRLKQNGEPHVIRPTQPHGSQLLVRTTSTSSRFTLPSSTTPFTVRPTGTWTTMPNRDPFKSLLSRFNPWNEDNIKPKPSKSFGSYAQQSFGQQSLKKKSLFTSEKGLNHDVMLKRPFESTNGFQGSIIDKEHFRHPEKPSHVGILTPPEFRENSSELELNFGDDYYGYDYLEDGYKGIGAMHYPGQHDDRPVIAIPLRDKTENRKEIKVSDFDENYANFQIGFKTPSKHKKEKFSKFPTLADGIDENLDVTIGEEGEQDENFQYTDADLSALFGNTKFTLPTDGSFPDRPKPTAAVIDFEQADTSDGKERKVSLSSIFRDLPSPDGYKPKIPDIYGMNEENYAKHYLQNPFGSDFVRLEVDPDRYSHNKSLGIRHIPLKVNGYPTTMQMPTHPKKIPIFKRPSRRPKKGKRKTPVRKRQLNKKPSSFQEPPPSIRVPSTMEELRKLMEEERRLKNIHRPPPPKVKLMPFPAPPRHKQRPVSSGRIPKKGPIPPFKKPLKKLKDQEPMSSIHVKKKPHPVPKRHPKLKPTHSKIPHLPMNNLMTDAMLNIPNAIKSLPNFMQKLISNHASFVGSGRSFTDGITLADINDYEYDEVDEEPKTTSSENNSQSKGNTNQKE